MEVEEGDVFENALNGDHYIVREIHDNGEITIESQLAAPNDERGDPEELLGSDYIQKRV